MAMISNALLKEKWKVQKKMAREAQYSIRQLMDNTEKVVRKILKEEFGSLSFAKQKNISKKLSNGYPAYAS